MSNDSEDEKMQALKTSPYLPTTPNSVGYLPSWEGALLHGLLKCILLLQQKPINDSRATRKI